MAFLLVVSGPSGSGKSALAVRLAEELSGEILNMDSVQVYRGLDIGSAKPTFAERRGVPHHLLDLVSPEARFSVGDYLGAAEPVINDLERRGKLSIVVGGTTLYLTALLHGLATLPQRNEELRDTLEAEASDALHRRLAAVDPTSALRLHPNDRVRVIRALEVCLSLGRPLSTFHDEHRYGNVRHRALILNLCWPRPELYRRINARAVTMVSSGLVAEVDGIIAQAGNDAPCLAAIGYAQARAVVLGTLAPELLANAVAQATRRYAKRQLTYLRNEPRKRGWRVEPGALDLVDAEGVDSRSPLGEPQVSVVDFAAVVRRVQEVRGGGVQPNTIWHIDAPSLLSTVH